MASRFDFRGWTPLFLTASALVLAAPIPGSLEAQEPDRLESAVTGLEWREIGPTIMGGRVSDLAVVESDPSTFYVGTASGGVWKTTSGGTAPASRR